MAAKHAAPAAAKELLRLPDTAYTRLGTAFCPNDEEWVFREAGYGFRLDFRRLRATTRLKASARVVLTLYAENRSLGTVEAIFRRLLRFLATEARHLRGDVGEVTGVSLLRYRGGFRLQQAHNLTLLSGFFQKWGDLDLPGLSNDAITVLQEMRFKKLPGSVAVRTMDPLKGPLTTIESESLLQALESSYGSGAIPLPGYVLGALAALLGARPIQYAWLKVSDVFVVTSAKGELLMYWLLVPSAKKKDVPPRTAFKKRRLVPHVGERLVRHAENVKAEFGGSVSDPADLPLFPDGKFKPRGNDVTLSGHATHQTIERRITSIYRRLKVTSERTGEPVRVSPRRLRSTVGTRGAEAGLSARAIADLMDHTQLSSVLPYIEATATMRDRLDQSLAELAPLVESFRGQVVQDGDQLTSTGEPAPRIADPRFDEEMRPLGSCAHHGPCDLLVPLACYTCALFRPWAKAPHKNVLKHLLAERDRLKQAGRTQVLSAHDLTILAAARVIQLCEAHGEEGEGDSDG